MTEAVCGTLSRAWDAYDAYLFDIDGTLLCCSDATHYFAFCAALESMTGRPLTLDGVTAHGNTDRGILRDALQLAGVPEELWRPQLAAACEGMCAFIEERQNAICAQTLPGVSEVLRHLRQRGALLGVATGNLERIGRIKLARCGLLDRFDFYGFSDAFEYRVNVFSHALEQARRMLPDGVAVCVVGDTPADIRAAHESGVEVIAVATGVHSLAALSAEQPELCTESLQRLLASPARDAHRID